MKIQPTVAFTSFIIILGLLTLTVFQKGVATVNGKAEATMVEQENELNKKPSSNLREVILRNKIISLEKQIKHLSSQQKDIIYNMEEMLAKLQNTIAVCKSLSSTEEENMTTTFKESPHTIQKI